ncbi:MAG: hypothetical protein GY943_03010 [Chloroflexi bacterium]|nr:hypothetical protein [Chloroflexota bacterium]
MWENDRSDETAVAIREPQAYEEVSFTSEDGVDLSGRLFGQSGDVAIVMAHKGYATQDSWRDFATTLAEKGFAHATDLFYTPYADEFSEILLNFLEDLRASY